MTEWINGRMDTDSDDYDCNVMWCWLVSKLISKRSVMFDFRGNKLDKGDKCNLHGLSMVVDNSSCSECVIIVNCTENVLSCLWINETRSFNLVWNNDMLWYGRGRLPLTLMTLKIFNKIKSLSFSLIISSNANIMKIVMARM